MSVASILNQWTQYHHELPEYIQAAQFVAVQTTSDVWELPTTVTQTIMQPQDRLTHWIITTTATQHKTCTRFYTNFLRCSPDYGIQSVWNSAESEYILSERDYKVYPPAVATTNAIYKALAEAAPHLDDVRLDIVEEPEQLDIEDSDPTLVYLYLTDQL